MKQDYYLKDSRIHPKTVAKSGPVIGTNFAIDCSNTAGKWVIIGAGAVVRRDISGSGRKRIMFDVQEGKPSCFVLSLGPQEIYLKINRKGDNFLQAKPPSFFASTLKHHI